MNLGDVLAGGVLEENDWTKSRPVYGKKQCKDMLKCKLFSKSEVSDGYTETTSLENIEKIVQIYESNGGIRCEN